jgi:hypothetical protein
MNITEEEIKNIDIGNIVILDTDAAGDMFMETLFPLWTNVVIVTLGGKYPINEFLKKRVFEELANNSNINCIQFGADSEKLSVKTEKKLKMSYFLIKDLTFLSYQNPEFSFDAEMIVSLMMSFTGDSISRLNKDRLNSYDYIISNARPESVKWYHELIKSSKK